MRLYSLCGIAWEWWLWPTGCPRFQQVFFDRLTLARSATRTWTWSWRHSCSRDYSLESPCSLQQRRKIAQQTQSLAQNLQYWRNSPFRELSSRFKASSSFIGGIEGNRPWCLLCHHQHRCFSYHARCSSCASSAESQRPGRLLHNSAACAVHFCFYVSLAWCVIILYTYLWHFTIFIASCVTQLSSPAALTQDACRNNLISFVVVSRRHVYVQVHISNRSCVTFKYPTPCAFTVHCIIIMLNLNKCRHMHSN